MVSQFIHDQYCASPAGIHPVLHTQLWGHGNKQQLSLSRGAWLRGRQTSKSCLIMVKLTQHEIRHLHQP
jgi:hypothetical protein